MSKAIFLGSFNPPHKGHYNCIKSVIKSDVMNRLNIDKIHIIPCRQNPNKGKYGTTYLDRYAMCNYMFHDYIEDNKVIIDEIENKFYFVYTYDLLKFIHTGQYPAINKDFWWIITYETYNELIEQEWYRSIQLRIENKFIVIVKNNDEIKRIKEEEKNNDNIRFVKLIGNFNMHSTELRERSKYEDISEYTNEDVNQYIKTNELYLK